MFNMFCNLVVFSVYLFLIRYISGVYPNTLAWNGGPLHLQCEHGIELWTRTGQYVKENVIAIKALTFQDEIYVITPRMKHGVLASVWLLIRTKQGVELQPFPELRDHKISDCNSIQNGVDFFLDHIGNLWVLDSGIVDTLEAPRCTCQPKVVVISLILGRLVNRIDISYLTEPNSLLQSLVVEYDISGKSFLYVSDASRGAVLVHEISSGSEWSAIVCPASSGLQLALVKRGPMHSILILIRLYQNGLLELDTGALRRRNSKAPLRVFGEHSKPVVFLGADVHHIYLRHTECSDVLSWDTRDVFNVSQLNNIHSAGPRLMPTSVAADPLRPLLLILDSNYADSMQMNMQTYHKITFTAQH